LLLIWGFITDLGDTAVTTPLALLMMCFLAAAKQLRLAIVWAVAILGCAGIISGVKLALDVCGSSSGLESPSGHAAMSAAVYGGFAAVIGAKAGRWARTALIAGAAALIIAIPLSRVVLHVHTPIEVVVGLAVGLAAVVIILAAVARWQERLPVLWLGAAAIVLAMLFHGDHWPAERAIRHLAGWFDMLRPWCS
jgi:membrane-associated phospholipid phosphatase